MTHQQVEIMVRKQGDKFSARLRLQHYDGNGDIQVFEADLPWKEVGEYCDIALVDKGKVGYQQPTDPVLYDQRTVGTDTLRRFNFREVTKDWGPTRTRIVNQDDLQDVIEESRVEGYKVTAVSPPNNAREVTVVFERSA
jgi:hypothetical protein